ncbi:MAG: glycosyltransferase [Xanthomonadales bacterium]|nr:glycosyltransferase [Xanthomonadales bacterium]
MKRVLIVSPHFPPTNAADCHRVRTYLPHLASLGWQAEVLCVEPADVFASQDPLLCESLPDHVPIHRVPARATLLQWLARGKTLGPRSFRFLRSHGDRLLHPRTFDLVFFSTTAFTVFRLGPRWKQRHGVPFVIDLQDPWVNDFYRLNPEITPPGGRLRHFRADRQARRWEQRVLAAAAAVVSVSPRYRSDILARHPQLGDLPWLVLPFGASAADFELLDDCAVKQSRFDPRDGRKHIVYVGRGGPDLEASLTRLFEAFARLLDMDSDTAGRLSFHFFGTSYAPEGRLRDSVMPLAEKAGVARWVEEQPSRIPYFEALRCLRDAHGLFLPASADTGYNPSKVYNLLLAGRPLLAIAPGGSVAERELSRFAGAMTLADSEGQSQQAVLDWLKTVSNQQQITLPTSIDCESASQARKLVELFNAVTRN